MSNENKAELYKSPSQGEDVIKLKPFYVYELVDPFTDQVFYVGKGKDERGHAHGNEALSSEEKSEKLNRIREIRKNEKEVVVRVVGRYGTEKEAFAVEATLIHWMYGFKNLTNIARGHGSSTIRERGDLNRLEGIDIPERKIGQRDGVYSQKCREDRVRYGVEEAMRRIKNYLESNSELIFSGVDISNPRWTTISLERHGVKLVVGKHNSSREEYWIEVQSLNGKKVNREKVKDLCGRSALEVKADGGYAKYPKRGSRLKDPYRILEDVQLYYNEI